MRRFARFACIDWSGARTAWQRGIAVAVCYANDAAPRLVSPPDRAWSREAVLAWLLDNADADMLIGVDFSASLPFSDEGAFFPGHAESPADARALWRFVDARSALDPHLAATSFVSDPALAGYFRVGTATGARFASRDPLRRNGRLRRVEAHVASGRPTSSFNLVGAAQVGLSSLTGMRVLNRLAGHIAIWPFDPVPLRGAVLVELYTSIAAAAAGRPLGATKMKTIEALNAALTSDAIASARYPGAGAIDDHSSDALLTAAWLRRAAGRAALWSPQDLDAVRDAEGWTFGVP
ncbi:MAG: hypothetical protein JOY99_17085 [Sphingomonadaceae bacterium]|nr:hypothetical protein [Sphingomonadaceae bacterium]